MRCAVNCPHIVIRTSGPQERISPADVVLHHTTDFSPIGPEFGHLTEVVLSQLETASVLITHRSSAAPLKWEAALKVAVSEWVRDGGLWSSRGQPSSSLQQKDHGTVLKGIRGEIALSPSALVWKSSLSLSLSLSLSCFVLRSFCIGLGVTVSKRLLGAIAQIATWEFP